MTTPENRKQRSPARVGIETAGVNPSGADRLVSQTTAMQTSASVLASRSPEAVSNIEALARGTHALSRAVEERGNSGFSPSFRVSINSNEPGPLPQAHGTLGSFFDNSLLPVGGGRPCRKTVTMIKAQTPKGTPAREQQCFGRCEHAARRFVQAPERDGIEPRGKPPGRASVTAPQHAGQSGPA